MRKRTLWVAIGAALLLVTGGVVGATVSIDFGARTEERLAAHSEQLFGVNKPVAAAAAAADLSEAQALANPAGLVTLANGLKKKVISAGKAAPNLDQMVLWPRSSPQYLIAANEEGTAEPGLQKISLATGVATTIVSGIDDNDPVRATPWGTILVGEEAEDGAMYEIIHPLTIHNATIDRSTGVSSSANIRRLDALGFNAFEGLAILPNGVTYYGNELAAEAGAPGGAYYKFVPTHPWTGGSSITSLDQSPYAGGSVFALRIGTSGNNGQGFQYGTGSWQPIAGNGAPFATARGRGERNRLLPAGGHRHRHTRARGRECPLLRQ